MNNKTIKKGEPQEVGSLFFLVKRGLKNAVIRHKHGA